MKFFLKRADSGFDILDESAHPKYTVSVKTDRNKQKIIIKNHDKQPVAEIFNKRLMEHDALMFDGKPLTDEERQQVFNTIDYVARLAERLDYED